MTFLKRYPHIVPLVLLMTACTDTENGPSFTNRTNSPLSISPAASSNSPPLPNAIASPVPTSIATPAPTPVPTPSSSSTPRPSVTPTPQPSPSPSPSFSQPPSTPPNVDLTGSASLDIEELRFFELINTYRQGKGIVKLEISVTLTRASDWLSTDMVEKDYFDHIDSQGRDPFNRMDDFGYLGATSSGENIAAGFSSAQETFNQWKSSPAHNSNMLSSSYRTIGIGRASNEASSYGWYWTTDFGSKTNTTSP